MSIVFDVFAFAAVQSSEGLLSTVDSDETKLPHSTDALSKVTIETNNSETTHAKAPFDSHSTGSVSEEQVSTSEAVVHMNSENYPANSDEPSHDTAEKESFLNDTSLTTTTEQSFSNRSLATTDEQKPTEAQIATSELKVLEETATAKPSVSVEPLSDEASKLATNELEIAPSEEIRQTALGSSAGRIKLLTTKAVTEDGIASTEGKQHELKTTEVGKDDEEMSSSTSLVGGVAATSMPASEETDQESPMITTEEEPLNSNDLNVTLAVESLSAVKEESLVTADPTEKVETSSQEVTTAEPTEGSFTFMLPDFHAQESSNSSTGHEQQYHDFNETEWAVMGAAASAEDADEMFDDPCAYLGHRVDNLLGLNITKQNVQKLIVDLNLGKFEEETLPSLKKIVRCY